MNIQRNWRQIKDNCPEKRSLRSDTVGRRARRSGDSEGTDIAIVGTQSSEQGGWRRSTSTVPFLGGTLRPLSVQEGTGGEGDRIGTI